jgi:hypothetical protein
VKALKKDGMTMAIVRPEDPKKAMEIAKEMLGKKVSNEEFSVAFFTAQTYTFVGLLGDDRKSIIHPKTGMRIEAVRLGDSIVGYESLKAAELGKAAFS